MRYKRLNYGTNSAEDIFNKAMDDTIAARNGVFHIRDYFIVEKATQTMTRPLKLGVCGLTFNPKKCMFHLPRIEFVGFIFSKDRPKPSPTE